MASSAHVPVEAAGAGPARAAEPGGGVDAGPAGWRDRTLVLVTAVVTLPLVWLGYGTDLDIGDVLETAALIRHGDYEPSRNPGVPVVEAIVAVLDPLGGHVLVNLATAGALAATVVGIARLVRAWGHRNGDLVALSFLASPVVVVAGTQTADFVWATAFATWGALALLGRRPLVAGLLLGLAVGCRSSTLLLVGTQVVAVGWAGRRRRALTAGGGAAARRAALRARLVVLRPHPPVPRDDRRLGEPPPTTSPGSCSRTSRSPGWPSPSCWRSPPRRCCGPAPLGRGPDAAVRRARLRGHRAVVPHHAVKPTHLVPCVLTLVLWIGASARNDRRFLWVLVAATALNGVVTFRPFVADEPDTTSGGDFDPALTLGWLVNDVRCRVEYMDEPPRIDSGAWACTLEPMRGPAGGATGEVG